MKVRDHLKSKSKRNNLAGQYFLVFLSFTLIGRNMMHEIYPGESESGANGLFDTIGTTLSWDRRHKMIKITINLRMSLSVVAVGRLSHEKWHYFYAEASY